MPGMVDGKVAIVTGAAGGLGRAAAQALAEAGASLVLTDVVASGAADDLAAPLPTAIFVSHDVSAAEAWESVIDIALDRCGQVDILVNNAGILVPGDLLEMELEDYDRTIAVNQTGALLGMRAVVPSMKKSGGGSIINMSSSAGLNGSRGAIAYATSKWAVRGMTKCAALELAPWNIRVNSVHPGRHDTPMMRSAVPEGASERDLGYGVPLGRVGRPDELAQLVAWLASDLSAYCTGAEFLADGGQTAQFPTSPGH